MRPNENVKPDKSQTPAPKVSSGKDTSQEKTSFTKEQMNSAEKGAAKKTSATKTPQKIQDGEMNKKNK